MDWTGSAIFETSLWKAARRGRNREVAMKSTILVGSAIAPLSCGNAGHAEDKSAGDSATLRRK